MAYSGKSKVNGTVGFRKVSHWNAREALSQRTHAAMITSLWRQNDVATSFWRRNDVFFKSLFQTYLSRVARSIIDCSTTYPRYYCAMCPLGLKITLWPDDAIYGDIDLCQHCLRQWFVAWRYQAIITKGQWNLSQGIIIKKDVKKPISEIRSKLYLRPSQYKETVFPV